MGAQEAKESRVAAHARFLLVMNDHAATCLPGNCDVENCPSKQAWAELLALYDWRDLEAVGRYFDEVYRLFGGVIGRA